MKRIPLALCSLTLSLGLASVSSVAAAQQARAPAPRGVVTAPSPSQDTAVGWSVKKSLLGKPVFNEKDEKIGDITDLLIAPDSTVSHIVVEAGGFVGQPHHDIAIETAALEVKNGKFYVEGANRDNVKKTPSVGAAAGAADWL